jgi:hypothetical protein
MGLLTQYHLRCEEDLWPDMMMCLGWACRTRSFSRQMGWSVEERDSDAAVWMMTLLVMRISRHWDGDQPELIYPDGTWDFQDQTTKEMPRYPVASYRSIGQPPGGADCLALGDARGSLGRCRLRHGAHLERGRAGKETKVKRAEESEAN